MTLLPEDGKTMHRPTEIVICGGLPDGGAFTVAHVPGSDVTWRRRPAETEGEFRARVRREAAKASCVVYDGLPD